MVLAKASRPPPTAKPTNSTAITAPATADSEILRGARSNKDKMRHPAVVEAVLRLRAHKSDDVRAMAVEVRAMLPKRDFEMPLRWAPYCATLFPTTFQLVAVVLLRQCLGLLPEYLLRRVLTHCHYYWFS